MDAPRLLRDLLTRRAESDPDDLAFADAERSVTYAELLQRAAGQAQRLTELGVQPGDRVALAMSAGIAWVEAFWAAQLLGAATAGYNPHLPAEQLERQTARIRPRLVLVDGMLRDAPAQAAVPGDPPIAPDDVALLQPTSGTSGESRAAMLLHRTVLAYLRGDTHPWAHRGDVFVDWVPPWHDMALVRFLIGGVAHGVPCHIVEPSVRTIPLWLETISRVRATLTAAPDFAYRLASRMVDPAVVDLSSLRSVNDGGEPVQGSTLQRFADTFGLGHVLQPGYGLAEATLGVSIHPAGEPMVYDARGAVSMGPVRDGLEVRVDGDVESPGEILLRGEAIFAGYFDAPEDTAAALRNGWLHTGDVGYVDDAGRLYVLGRLRAMIKRGGAVIAPRELEEAAQLVAGVRLAAAVGVLDAAGEAVTLVVETDVDEDARAVLSARVTSAVTSAVGFGPREVLLVPPRTIPRTHNGKIRHAALRDMVLDGAVTARAA